jgi:hypothetical protein
LINMAAGCFAFVGEPRLRFGVVFEGDLAFG